MTIIALWATPRTVSTAFERMVIARGDHLVLDEPWSRAYYFGPERRSSRYPLVFPESTYAAVESGVMATADSHDRVFVKDMAYHAAPGISDEALDAMEHTFLVRDPAQALTSLARHWPDFTDEEAGYDAQLDLFRRIEARTGRRPHVIDSDELRADPAAVVGAWCDAVGLARRPDSLRWSPGMRPEWQLWRDWYGGAAASTGFVPPGPRPGGGQQRDDPGIVARLASLEPRARRVFEELRDGSR
jgi:hypothetical protein